MTNEFDNRCKLCFCVIIQLFNFVTITEVPRTLYTSDVYIYLNYGVQKLCQRSNLNIRIMWIVEKH